MADAFYEFLGGGRFASSPSVVGPWGAGLSHGSPPAALLMHEVERAHPRPDARVARVAFDFFGPVPVTELTVTSEIGRPGSRIELSRGRLSAQGRTAMEATVWRIAVAAGRVPEVPDTRDVPSLPGPQPQRLFVDVPSFGYGEALEWRFVDGAFDQVGPATVYSRPRMPLLAGEPLSPLERLLLMVDSANGISAELPPSRFTFVPVELTVSVRRHPRTEWVGMHAKTTIDADGIGQTHAELFDEAGYLGTAVQTLFVSPR
jgi:Thioesterase-like superfamily